MWPGTSLTCAWILPPQDLAAGDRDLYQGEQAALTNSKGDGPRPGWTASLSHHGKWPLPASSLDYSESKSPLHVTSGFIRHYCRKGLVLTDTGRRSEAGAGAFQLGPQRPYGSFEATSFLV